MVKYIIVKYQKFLTVHENMSFFTFKPLGNSFTKNIFNDFAVPIFVQI